MPDGALEKSGVSDSGFVSGPQTEDEAVSEAGTRRETGRRQRRSETTSEDSSMDLRSVSEVLAEVGLRPIFSSDCGEQQDTERGSGGDDSEAGEYAPEALPPISFQAFLGSGKTAVTIGTDGEAQINLQVHPNFLDEVIELLRRRNRVLSIEIR